MSLLNDVRVRSSEDKSMMSRSDGLRTGDMLTDLGYAVFFFFLYQSIRFNCSLWGSGASTISHWVGGWEARHPGQPSYRLKTLKGCGKSSGKINVRMRSMHCEPFTYSMWRTAGFDGTHTVNLSCQYYIADDGW